LELKSPDFCSQSVYGKEQLVDRISHIYAFGRWLYLKWHCTKGKYAFYVHENKIGCGFFT